MTHDPVELFLAAVKKSGLLSEQDLHSHGQEINTQGAGSQEEVAARLVERGALTPYQAERLLLGEGDECVLAGRYHLLEKIGSGGMGSVYRARDTKLNRVVAIKVMAPHNLNNPDAVVRFKREAQALAQLALPNVVQAFDSGEDRGRNFLVMEFVKGIGLDRLVRDKGKVPPTVAADYIYQTAVGMQRAHDRGLIHRDIKPGNLLLTSEGEIKVLDLGLARFIQDQLPDGELTRDNVGMGTPDYMAPEQFRDAHSVDPRADIYSLGCTLYYLIAGVVPFPGSSLSEKMHAHENKEPPPLGEHCPAVPAGLALAVGKMLAKRPADRFQSMRAVAEALAPYVAASSPSLPSIQRTISFHGSQLTAGPQQRKSRAPLVAGGVAVVAVLAALVIVLPGWLNPGSDPDDGKITQNGGNPQLPPDQNPPKTTEPGPKQATQPGGKSTPKQAPPSKVITIPNGLTVAQDGTGQYTTINAALDKVKPGQTIRVLDDAFYDEQVLINDPGRHAGITLDAVKGALLALQAGAKFALKVHAVPFVSVKGFRCQAKGSADEFNTSIILVEGQSPGVAIRDLNIKTPWKAVGLAVTAAPLQPGDAPIIVKNCQIDTGGMGIVVAGYGLVPAKRVLIQDNRITAPRGIILEKLVAEIQLSGNVLWDCTLAGVELRKLRPGCHGILLANNTICRAEAGLRLWDENQSLTPLEKDFHFEKGQLWLVNNVFSQPKVADMLLVHATPKTKKAVAKDSKFLLDLWTFAGNWRDLAGAASQPITPLSPADHELKGDPFLSTVPSHPQFLQPKKDSPLADSGVGKSDVAFPAYAGAVPPEGAAPWNWQWTWDAFMNKTLTVSQDAQDAARFNSITAALAKVTPGMTVRVLDKATYKEQVHLAEPERQKNTTLEAACGATIEMAPHADFALKIDHVPGVTVRGFRFYSEKHPTDPFKGLPQFQVIVKGRAPGAQLLDLQLDSTDKMGGIVIHNTPLDVGDLPVVVRGCTLNVGGYGLYVMGQATQPAVNVLLADNRVEALKGITLEMNVQHVQVTGNVVRNAAMVNVELFNLLPAAKAILIANNTLYEGASGLRFFESSALAQIPKGQIAVRNNVLLGQDFADMYYIKATQPKFEKATDSAFLLDACQFDHNWRDLLGGALRNITPKAKDDQELERKEFLTFVAADKNFLRPKKGSPLTTQGAGKDDPMLPTYVGAVPPEGVEPWDWQKTWALWEKKKRERPN